MDIETVSTAFTQHCVCFQRLSNIDSSFFEGLEAMVDKCKPQMEKEAHPVCVKRGTRRVLTRRNDDRN